jgi:hypothetical protein
VVGPCVLKECKELRGSRPSACSLREHVCSARFEVT